MFLQWPVLFVQPLEMDSSYMKRLKPINFSRELSLHSQGDLAFCHLQTSLAYWLFQEII